MDDLMLISLNYKVTKNEKLKIFDKVFVRNNKVKICYIYKNKRFKLTNIFEILKEDISEIKLKLKLFNIRRTKYNFRNMFKDCSSLIKFSIDPPDKEEKKLNRNNNTNITISNDTKEALTQTENIISEKDENSPLKLFDVSENKSFDFYPYTIIEFSEKNSSKDDIYSFLSLRKYDTYSKKIIVNNMNNMFIGCSSLLSITNLHLLDTSEIKELYNIFYECSSLKFLSDISSWNTKEAESMQGLFVNCRSLKTLPDISRWNTSNVVNMNYMFHDCSLLESLPDISKWDILKPILKGLKILIMLNI